MSGPHPSDETLSLRDPGADVLEHVITCSSCHQRRDEARAAAEALDLLPRPPAPAGTFERIAATLDRKAPARRMDPRLLFAAAAVLVALALGVTWLRSVRPLETWTLATADGTTSTVSAGSRIEPPSRVEIASLAVGRVEIEAGSRVRIVRANLLDHVLALDRGRIHARVLAPPRVFSVQTPSAVAVDLGCEYELSVEDDGSSLLKVVSGWVAYVRGTDEVIVPAGAACRTTKEHGTGTPFLQDAPAALLDLLARLDAETGVLAASDIDALEVAARPRDALSLLHLVQRAEGSSRERLVDWLLVQAPPPSGVEREGVLALAPRQLERWRLAVEPRRMKTD